jgi:2-aminoadipate transaminase
MDADGLIPQELERLICEVRAAGKTAKGLYTIPNFQNPGGVNLAADRRQQVGELCRNNGLLIFEDNPYGLLGFDGETMRAIQPEFEDITRYFGSFSKMIAPGLRVGWVLPPDALYNHMLNASETSQLNPSVFSQQLISAYLVIRPGRTNWQNTGGSIARSSMRWWKRWNRSCRREPPGTGPLAASTCG